MGWSCGDLQRAQMEFHGSHTTGYCWAEILRLDAVKPDFSSFSNRLTSGRLDTIASPPDAPEPEALDIPVLPNSKFNRWPITEGRGHDGLPLTTTGARSCRNLESGYVKGSIGNTIELPVICDDGRQHHAERWLH